MQAQYRFGRAMFSSKHMLQTKGRDLMKCKKCDGLMVLQLFFDHFLNFDGWKCLNCGKIILRKDKTIEFDTFSIFYQQQKCRNKN